MKGGLKKSTFVLVKAARLIFPFSWVMDLFLSPCSSLIGPHLLPMSFSINDSAREALKCFYLSLPAVLLMAPKSLRYMCEVTQRL